MMISAMSYGPMNHQFNLEGTAKQCESRFGKKRTLKPQAKHTIKVHVWAGISMRGATKICIFDQVKDASLYIGILREFLLPFIRK